LFKEILEYLGYRLKQMVTSRLFPLGLIFTAMFAVLLMHLFQLQIIEGEAAQEAYIEQKTLRTISLPSTRGNIYDRNGELLAYNELVYAVTLTDTGAYSNGYKKNLMILTLLDILERNGETVVQDIPIFFDSNGQLQYRVEGTARLRFLRDMYGKKSIEEMQADKDCDENLSAQGVYDYLYERYGIGKTSSKGTVTYEIDRKTALQLMNVRYLLASNAYQRYRSVVVVSGVKAETMTEILEHSDSMQGVDIEENYKRVYTDSVYFAHILGYTGKASSDQLTTLNAEYPEGEERYELGDVVGQSGIEASMESELQGTKGSRTMYLDSLGRVLEVVEEVKPVTGNDVYLTIDHDLQVGLYYIMEQHLAGILSEKLLNDRFTVSTKMKASERMVSIYDAYFQLVNNNILSMNSFASEEAGAAEKRIYAQFLSGMDQAIADLRGELLSGNPTPYKDLSPEVEENQDNYMKIYMSYIYVILMDQGYLIEGSVDQNDATYIAYKTDETISLSEFLRYALSKNWVDLSKLDLNEKYTSADETYQVLVDKTCELLRESSVFGKKVYQKQIKEGAIPGNDLCLALFEQGVLASDEAAVASLSGGNTTVAYEFLKDKVESLEITPAQLALDPSSGAITITDVKTGGVIASVSYPSYDNNLLSGSVDAAYYYQLNNDLSHPLYNSATQAQTAPGSVFKLVTTAAALEQGKITPVDLIKTEGIFTQQGLNLACAIYSSSGSTHGTINIIGAIRDSCNYFFSELGYRLSQDENGDYREPRGVDIIKNYAEQLGLGSESGIELRESPPQISDTAPIPSAIGQGTNLFSNVQLARYLATLANGGTVYKLTLLDKLTDSEGNVLEEYSPQIVGTTTFSSSTWEVIQEGMRRVTTENTSTRNKLSGNVQIAGKTGTAEENKLRPNHANFIGYAPYDNPEIGVTVTIPYGYTSGNSVLAANDVFDFYYEYLTLDEILQRDSFHAEEDSRGEIID